MLLSSLISSGLWLSFDEAQIVSIRRILGQLMLVSCPICDFQDSNRLLKVPIPTFNCLNSKSQITNKFQITISKFETNLRIKWPKWIRCIGYIVSIRTGFDRGFSFIIPDPGSKVTKCLGHWKLEFGYCLRFAIWCLVFFSFKDATWLIHTAEFYKTYLGHDTRYWTSKRLNVQHRITNNK